MQATKNESLHAGESIGAAGSLETPKSCRTKMEMEMEAQIAANQNLHLRLRASSTHSSQAYVLAGVAGVTRKRRESHTTAVILPPCIKSGKDQTEVLEAGDLAPPCCTKQPYTRGNRVTACTVAVLARSGG